MIYASKVIITFKTKNLCVYIVDLGGACARHVLIELYM